MPRCDNAKCGYQFKEGDPCVQRIGEADVPLFFCGDGCLEQWKEDL